MARRSLAQGTLMQSPMVNSSIHGFRPSQATDLQDDVSPRSRAPAPQRLSTDSSLSHSPRRDSEATLRTSSPSWQTVSQQAFASPRIAVVTASRSSGKGREVKADIGYENNPAVVVCHSPSRTKRPTDSPSLQRAFPRQEDENRTEIKRQLFEEAPGGSGLTMEQLRQFDSPPLKFSTFASNSPAATDDPYMSDASDSSVISEGGTRRRRKRKSRVIASRFMQSAASKGSASLSRKGSTRTKKTTTTTRKQTITAVKAVKSSSSAVATRKPQTSLDSNPLSRRNSALTLKSSINNSESGVTSTSAATGRPVVRKTASVKRPDTTQTAMASEQEEKKSNSRPEPPLQRSTTTKRPMQQLQVKRGDSNRFGTSAGTRLSRSKPTSTTDRMTDGKDRGLTRSASISRSSSIPNRRVNSAPKTSLSLRREQKDPPKGVSRGNVRRSIKSGSRSKTEELSKQNNSTLSADLRQHELWEIRMQQLCFLNARADAAFHAQERAAMDQLETAWSLVEQQNDTAALLERKLASLRYCRQLDDLLTVEAGLSPMLDDLSRLYESYSALAKSISHTTHALPVIGISTKQPENIVTALNECLELTHQIQHSELGPHSQLEEFTEKLAELSETIMVEGEELDKCNGLLSAAQELELQERSIRLQRLQTAEQIKQATHA